jgi:hypothetical protein
MSSERSIWTGLGRGLARRCLNCGAGRLLKGFLTIRSPCEVCGSDNHIYPSDDFPPYLTIFVTGHLVIPLFIWTDAAFEPALWLQGRDLAAGHRHHVPGAPAVHEGGDHRALLGHQSRAAGQRDMIARETIP